MKNNEHQEYLRVEVMNTDVPKNFVLNSKNVKSKDQSTKMYTSWQRGGLSQSFPLLSKAERC